MTSSVNPDANPAAILLSAPHMRAKRAAVSESATHPPARILSTAAPAAHTPLHVLIADGNDMSRERREAQLREEGFRVSAARTSFEAIVKASCFVPDVVLIDESIGDIEAAETGRLLTTCPVTAHIPVVRLVRGRRLPHRVLSRLKRAG